MTLRVLATGKMPDFRSGCTMSGNPCRRVVAHEKPLGRFSAI